MYLLNEWSYGHFASKRGLEKIFFRMLLKEETFYKEKNGYHNRNGTDIKQKQRFNSNK